MREQFFLELRLKQENKRIHILSHHIMMLEDKKDKQGDMYCEITLVNGDKLEVQEKFESIFKKGGRYGVFRELK